MTVVGIAYTPSSHLHFHTDFFPWGNYSVISSLMCLPLPDKCIKKINACSIGYYGGLYLSFIMGVVYSKNHSFNLYTLCRNLNVPQTRVGTESCDSFWVLLRKIFLLSFGEMILISNDILIISVL